MPYIVAAASSRIPSYSEKQGMTEIRAIVHMARHLHKKKTKTTFKEMEPRDAVLSTSDSPDDTKGVDPVRIQDVVADKCNVSDETDNDKETMPTTIKTENTDTGVDNS